jgi:iron-sulfur cluster repair protein YtfE (RIC family)
MITSGMTVRDAIAAYPATRPIFARHRLESCCGGAHSIAAVALARGVDPDRLLGELRAAAEGP